MVKSEAQFINVITEFMFERFLVVRPIFLYVLDSELNVEFATWPTLNFTRKNYIDHF